MWCKALHNSVCFIIQNIQVWISRGIVLCMFSSEHMWQRCTKKKKTAHREEGRKVIAAEYRANICSYLPQETLSSFSRGTTPPGPIKTKSKASCPITRKDNSSSSINYPITENTCSSCVHFFFNLKEGQLLFPGQFLNRGRVWHKLFETERQWETMTWANSSTQS